MKSVRKGGGVCTLLLGGKITAITNNSGKREVAAFNIHIRVFVSILFLTDTYAKSPRGTIVM